MRVSDLLKIPSLQRLQVVAGHSGLNRQVYTVSVMDAPDIYDWMNGGEFLITSAYPVKDDLSYLTALIRRLDRAGVAAFGVKISRFIGSFPQDAIDTANQLGLPLISIPEDYAFTDIIDPVLYRIVDMQASRLIQVENIRKRFIQLAIGSKGPEAILKALSEITGCESAFLDTYFHKRFFSAQGTALECVLEEMGSEQDILCAAAGRFARYPVKNGKTQYGYVLLGQILEHGTENEDVQPALEYAGIVLMLDVQTRISNHQVEMKHRDEFIGDLIFNNIKSDAELYQRSKIYHWDLSRGGVAVIVDINHIKRHRLQTVGEREEQKLEEAVELIFNTVQRVMSERFSQALYYKLSDHIVYILPGQSGDGLYSRVEQAFLEMRRQISASTPYTVSIGVGNYQANIRDIHQSYQQARLSVNLGYQLHRYDCVLSYRQLRIYQLLFAMEDHPVAKELRTQLMGPLLAHDSQYHTSLFPFVETLLRCGWNLKETAKALFIHYNTAKYRYTKVCELLGMDLKDSEQRLHIELAVRLQQIDDNV